MCKGSCGQVCWVLLVERFTAQRDRMIAEDPAAAELALTVLRAVAEYVIEEHLQD